MKYQKIRKIISFISSISLVFQTFLPLTFALPVYAEDATPAAIVDVSPTPEVTPEITPEVTPTIEPTPEISPEATPIPEPTPEITPTPEVTPEVTPEITPEITPEVTPTIEPTPAETQNNSPPAEETPNQPTVTTDKSDYVPTDTVQVAGMFFLANTPYTSTVTSETDNYSNVENVTTDDIGSFMYFLPLLGEYRPDYSIAVTDSTNEVVAATTFTDSDCDNSTTFDTFNNGTVNNQGGWKSTGSYDQEIVENNFGFKEFGCKTLRLSNAVATGSFGDQTFSFSIPNEAGETSAQNNGLSGGTRQNHFEAQFDIATIVSNEQTGLSISVSPDRGDGARMSYLRFEDQSDDIHVIFADYKSGFIEKEIDTLDRKKSHTIKFVMDFVDGPANDIVNIYIDNKLKHTGLSWEDYYRDFENNPTRTVDSLLFRAGGSGVTDNSGKGYLFDNVNISSSSINVETVDFCHGTPVDTAAQGMRN